MTIKRIGLLIFTLLVSLTCVGIMNIHYDVLSRYTYEISDSDAEKLRKYLTYKEINYLIDYSISSDLFIEYIEQDGFNVYHFPLYNRIKDLIGSSYSNGNIVYYAERAIKADINEDELINYIGMGYELSTIVSFYEENGGLLKKDVLAYDPLNYDFEFKENNSIYTLVPYDLLTVDYILNENGSALRNRVYEQLRNLLIKVDDNVSFNVFEAVSITNGFKSYDDVISLRKTGDRTLVAGRNYYQLGRMFTLSRDDRYTESFFETFNEYAADYGFVLTNQETHEYLYVGR